MTEEATISSTTVTAIELDDVMTTAEAPFSERHHRRIDLPIEQVWPAANELRASEIRAFGPLMKLRKLPSMLSGKGGLPTNGEEGAFFDDFTEEGFVIVRRDQEPIDGRALVVFGAAGKFWKPVGNDPVAFDEPRDFADFDEPKHAVIAASMEAIDRGDHTELITETRVRGTDRGSTLRFAPYWAIIRYPSGLIRRSWLAAIERRARQRSGG